ncbi:hypothetical protein GCM10009533_56940 [Saccharopolyspora spinosporotrichia]|uniref:Uncharacterized protein n=1 Tax=Saccharopolyspora erythraea TaxID=1836 RepID=A0ABN1DSQ9_SACER
MVADPHVRRDERGRIVRRGRQHPQRLPQGDRRLVGHACELATTDHADDGGSGAMVHAEKPKAVRRPACAGVGLSRTGGTRPHRWGCPDRSGGPRPGGGNGSGSATVTPSR